MKMTHNEYIKFLEMNASRFYNDPGYTMSQYKKDADRVELLPFDLSNFPQILPETKTYINKLFETETTDRNNNYMLRGFTRHEYQEIKVLNCNIGEHSTTYSLYAFNDNEMLIYSYCEGDTTLTIFCDHELYQVEKVNTTNWYRENNN